MNRFLTLLDTEPTLLLDGAMGTMLMAAGLAQGASLEEWNVLHPERVRAIHRAYIEVGSRVILTNSFGGNRFRLKLHNLQARAVELNHAAATLACKEANAAPRAVAVAGSMGPTGEWLEPLGTMTFAEAEEAFAEQAAALAVGGADVLWIETMSDLNEVRAAVQGARRACDLPIVATFSFDTRGRTLLGVTAAQAAAALRGWGVAALGANCGSTLADTEAAIRAMREAGPTVPLIAKANAGIPRWAGGELVYDVTPAMMAAHARRAHKVGARLIGGCCGSSPAHVAAMAAALSVPV